MHQKTTTRYSYQGSDYTGRYAVLQEINVCQIKLTHFIFLGCSDGRWVVLSGVKRGARVNVRGLIGKPRDRHTHPSGADKPSNKNEEICLVAWEVLSDRLSYRNKEDTRYCVADERGDDLHQIVTEKINAKRRKQLTRTTVVSTTITPNSDRPSTSRRMRMSILSNRPLDVTPFPSAIPPIARKTTDHRNCSKSSCGQGEVSVCMQESGRQYLLTFFKTPVPKKATIGMIAITPISPIHLSILCSRTQRVIVTTHTSVTHHCFTVKRSRVGRMLLISRLPPLPMGKRDGR